MDHYAACARASPWLWLTPYAGLSATAAVDGFIAGGWATGELAVRFAEAYATLAGDGRFAQVPATWTRLIRAALQHPLSADQVQRLLRAAHALPIDMRLSMDLHARSEPGDCWYAALQQRLAAQQRAAAAAAGAANCAVPARFTLSPAKQRV